MTNQTDAAENRAWRIADQAALDFIACNGTKGAGVDEYLLGYCDIAADDYLNDCIEHLLRQALATRHEVDEDTVSVQLYKDI
jgi:hypothetical protein